MSFWIRQLNGFPLCVIDQCNIQCGNLGPFHLLIFFALKVRVINQDLLGTFSGYFRIVSKGTKIVLTTKKLTAHAKANGMVSILRVDGEGQNFIIRAINHRALQFVGGDTVTVSAGPIGCAIGKVFDQSSLRKFGQFL